jgi:hypothetical protein
MEVIEMGTKFQNEAIWPAPHDVQFIKQANKRPQLRVGPISIDSFCSV